MDTILPLQDWLKLLNSRGCDMRAAMSLAAKIYNSHNTKSRLVQLDAKKLSSILTDKDQRKAVINAVRGLGTNDSPSKKRTRDSDLLEPLQSSVESDLPQSLTFDEVRDPESLIPLTVTTNRAPVKTAWVFVVAQRMGFDTQESLSIAHVYVHLSSLKHALMLGNILTPQETKEAEEELRELPGEEKRRKVSSGKLRGRGRKEEEDDVKVGSSQPWVGIMKAIPVVERSDGSWRALEKGVPVEPSQAYLYISRAFKEYTSHVIGALRLLADSWTPDELNRMGLSMYNAFKPDVEKWGQRGTLECAKILNEMRGPISTSKSEPPFLDNTPDHINHDDRKEISTGDSKSEGQGKALEPINMSLEEYEKMLDEETPGGYIDPGDIP
ncbi:hypothetical protein TREMEDRAFT_28164 [Tremella mesenterica DSM 1558]|uniref:uncharacterized protein n=1 Tax=Tremella mesenterica (strain ATCC 24925 / CBS 8224 / DSM 1558 / NBRC 9311 / NRRL Y-6157 / RJB 2259-6 / UBC 559-6) TaxID=578456 RepID=UPI0003F4914E|nr:uncharacterized protein TREMEDRAFT_28164 [Tremella mesenterica DSM 1558]EIW71720.1 hypothetical protein TREMEDRAFT_28164 [Tremella mesenterica DSM 1558]